MRLLHFPTQPSRSNMLKFVAVVAFIAVANAQYLSSGLSYGQPLAYTRYAQAPLTVAHAPLAVAHAPLAVAHAPVAVAHAPVAIAPAARIEENDPHPQYSYSYSVNDAVTGDNKEQHESRDGDVVSGSYSLVEADGTRRIVDYTADPINGFNAQVHKEPAVAHAPVAVAAPAPVIRTVAAAPAIRYAAAPTIRYAAAPTIRYAAAPSVTYAAPAVSYAAPSYTVAHAPVGVAGHSSPVLHLIVDGNTKTELSNRKDPGLFCGETEQPQTFISETSFVKLVFHVDNFTDQTYFSFDSRAEQQFDVYLRYGQHPELYPNRRGQIAPGTYCERTFTDCRLQTCYVQSPAYPGIYPRHLHCTYKLNTRQPFIKLYIENEEFNIDGQRCENIMTCPMRPISSGAEHCPYDYIKIYDGKDASYPVIGTFCGMGKFPYSIIGTSEDLFVEFVSSPAGPLLNTGFHFNVGNWPGHVETAGSRNSTCDWLLTAEDLARSGDSEGIFLSVAHWYPPHTSCTYLIQGKPNQVVRLYFPSFRINRIESPISVFDGDCGESLTLYDASWPDDSRIIKTFCDTFSRAMEKHDFVSTGNALFVRFESKTGSYSGSSLYYWAHYDFFNNTKFGTAVPGTTCDEEFSSWKSVSGHLRSPMNTLVYKRPENSSPLTCRYSFVTDRRLFARVILTVTAINFKEHPFNTGSCDECWEGRLDKLVVWEPGATNSTKPPTNGLTGGHCLCKNTNVLTFTKSKPIAKIISSTESLFLELLVDGAHAASSYFKHPAPLFEATYEFVHSPLCGPAVIPASTEGELHFPHLEALGYTEPPRSIRCIWEIRVNRERDVWLHFDKVKFTTRDCQDGRLEVYLPSRPDHPFLSICGHNVSSKDMPPLTSLDLTPSIGTGFLPQPSVKIQFIGTTTPARAAFKIAWTELYHLPRNPDGTLMTSKLTEGGGTSSPEGGGDCEFLCPGESGLCIPAALVCNGVVNCPAVGGRYNESLETGDEAPEVCHARTAEEDYNWLMIGLGAGGGALLAVASLLLVCSHKRKSASAKRPRIKMNVEIWA